MKSPSGFEHTKCLQQLFFVQFIDVGEKTAYIFFRNHTIKSFLLENRQYFIPRCRIKRMNRVLAKLVINRVYLAKILL